MWDTNSEKLSSRPSALTRRLGAICGNIWILTKVVGGDRGKGARVRRGAAAPRSRSWSLHAALRVTEAVWILEKENRPPSS